MSLAPPVFERETPAVVVEEFDLKALFSSSLTLLACFVLSCLLLSIPSNTLARTCAEKRAEHRANGRWGGRHCCCFFLFLSVMQRSASSCALCKGPLLFARLGSRTSGRGLLRPRIYEAKDREREREKEKEKGKGKSRREKRESLMSGVEG